MSDDTEIGSELQKVDLRELTLRIPGENFFTETIHIPDHIISGITADEENNRAIENYVLDVIENPAFSPYPSHQLAWGYYASIEDRKILVFATQLAKLRQLGWQSLEGFRRVFPSFVSILGKVFEAPTILFLLQDETLTVAVYDADCGIPVQLFSMPVEEGDKNSIDMARGKLLSLVDLENYAVLPDVLVASEVERLKNGMFRFEHEWLVGSSPELDLDQVVFLDGDELWSVDLRSLEYKANEKESRKSGRKRWKATLAWGLGMAAVFILFLSAKIFQVKVEDRQRMASEMAAEIPLVLDSQKLLEKLKQNKLGGIDPFGSIGRLYPYLGSTGEDLNVWFTSAHFESRNDIEISWEGKNVQLINLFLENLKKNKVAKLRVDRSGKEKRQIKSAKGVHTFDVEISLVEETLEANKVKESRNNITDNKEG